MSAIENVICCFCGLQLEERSAVLLVFSADKAREESQTVYAHRRCLASQLHESVPLHPDLLGDDDEPLSAD